MIERARECYPSMTDQSRFLVGDWFNPFAEDGLDP